MRLSDGGDPAMKRGERRKFCPRCRLRTLTKPDNDGATHCYRCKAEYTLVGSPRGPELWPAETLAK